MQTHLQKPNQLGRRKPPLIPIGVDAMNWFTHNFRHPVQWRGHMIVGLIVSSEGVTILDQHGRELRWLGERHL